VWRDRASNSEEDSLMDERERLEQYLAWRRAERRDRRGRLYRRLRLAGGATLALLVIALGVGLAGWPRATKRDVAGLPAHTPRVEPRTVASPPAPSLSTREALPSIMSDETPSAPPSRSRERVASPPRARPRPGVPAAPRTTAAAASRPEASGESSAPAASGSSEPAQRSGEGPSPGGAVSAAAKEVIVTPAPAPEVVVTPPPRPTVIVEPPAPPASSAPVAGPASTAPPVIAAPSPTAPAEPPTGAGPSDERLERLKRLAGYIPEVWLARSISRWMKAQPPGELDPPHSERELPQAR
jgi:hypothetical protein